MTAKKNFDLGSGWNPALSGAIQELISRHGTGSKNFNPKKKPLAVFDWDDTTIFGDLGDQCFRLQARTLQYSFTDREFLSLLPDREHYYKRLAPAFGGALIKDIAEDLAEDYEKLHSEYEGLGGSRPLAEIHRMDVFADFETKMCLFFHGLAATEGIGKAYAYPWSNRFYAGLTAAQIRAISRHAWEEAVAHPVEKIVLRSPVNMKTHSGAQSVEFNLGLRIVTQVVSLFSLLRENGFDVVIISASLEPVVAEIAGDPDGPYRLPPGNVLGMRLRPKKDGSFGRVIDVSRGYAITFGPGKVRVIENVLNRAPLLVAGDSDTDFDMLTEFPETQVRIIMDRGRRGVLAPLYDLAERGEKGFFIQKRDEKTGSFLP
jgi:phosphoserine phosphatase